MEIMIGKLLILLLDIFFWIIIIQVVMSWLLAFGVVNDRNPQAQNLISLMNKITAPVYKPLRKYIPAIGGIDITPIIIIFGISILKNIVAQIFFNHGV
ncbi:MAG TPA: YggT family protein [Alphaproteobacteria bacterium]|nr:YggT family protein [Alphaproteobacteria bacterium]